MNIYQPYYSAMFAVLLVSSKYLFEKKMLMNNCQKVIFFVPVQKSICHFGNITALINECLRGLLMKS